MNKTVRSHIAGDFQFALLRLGEREFGVAVGHVKEVIRLKNTERPKDCPSSLEGFIRLRNIEVPVLDLRKRFSFPAQALPGARIVIISIDGLITGLVVDAVTDISVAGHESAPMLEGGQPWSGCVQKTVVCQGRTVLVINASALLTRDEKQFLSAPLPEGYQ